MRHANTETHALGIVASGIWGEHAESVLDDEDLDLLPQIKGLYLVQAASTLRDFGFKLSDPGVAKNLVRRALELTQASGIDPRMTWNEIYRAKAIALRGQSQVYYVDLGEHIKIGYSVNMVQRLSALRVSLDSVLATEPGHLDLERMRHAQFEGLRIGRRENFHKGDELLSHIDMLVKHFGPPKITSYLPTFPKQDVA